MGRYVRPIGAGQAQVLAGAEVEGAVNRAGNAGKDCRGASGVRVSGITTNCSTYEELKSKTNPTEEGY